MKLSKKKSIKLCIELWTWLAKTGELKGEWSGWKEYGHAFLNCWFCEYSRKQEIRYGNHLSCKYCPLITSGLTKQKEGWCSVYFAKWKVAKTPRTRKKYAKLFLEQIKTIK